MEIYINVGDQFLLTVRKLNEIKELEKANEQNYHVPVTEDLMERARQNGALCGGLGLPY